MQKLLSMGSHVTLTITNLKEVITQIECDIDAQQVVIYYQPVKDYNVPFSIVHIDLDEEPNVLTLEALGISPQDVLNNAFIPNT